MAEHAATPGYCPELSLKPPTEPRRVHRLLPDLSAVISGGQTGVDQAALLAARRIGLATGGWAPLGFRTLDGPALGLGTEYGLVEAPSHNYSWRTAKNVLSADATIQIAENFASPGEIATWRAIERCKRPSCQVFIVNKLVERFRVISPSRSWADVDTSDQKQDLDTRDPKTHLLRFLAAYRVRVLNVAGNSEQTAPGIGAVAEAFLVHALSESTPR